MEVEVIPGGFTVTEDQRWWNVAWWGTTPTIVDHLQREVNPRSELGRKVVTAVRARLRRA